MFDRFTDRARKTWALARKEALRLGHDFISTEHILIGLIQEGSGVAASVLRDLGADLKRTREAVERKVAPGPAAVAGRGFFSRWTRGTLPFTPAAKQVLERSLEESLNLDHDYIGTEHVLLGILREPETVAVQVLAELGLDIDEVREHVLELLGARQSPERDSIDLEDRGRRLRARIALARDDQPSLKLFDQDGRERAVLRLEADGSPVFELKDKDGKVLFKAP